MNNLQWMYLCWRRPTEQHLRKTLNHAMHNALKLILIILISCLWLQVSESLHYIASLQLLQSLQVLAMKQDPGNLSNLVSKLLFKATGFTEPWKTASIYPVNFNSLISLESLGGINATRRISHNLFSFFIIKSKTIHLWKNPWPSA